MQRRVASIIRGVKRAVVVEQQLDHGHGAHGGGPVQRVLAALVPDARRDGGLIGEQLAGHLEVVLGGDEVEYGLFVRIPYKVSCLLRAGYVPSTGYSVLKDWEERESFLGFGGGWFRAYLAV